MLPDSSAPLPLSIQLCNLIVQHCDGPHNKTLPILLALCDGLCRLLITGPVHTRPAAGGPRRRQQLRAATDAGQPPRASLQCERGHPGYSRVQSGVKVRRQRRAGTGSIVLKFPSLARASAKLGMLPSLHFKAREGPELRKSSRACFSNSTGPRKSQ